ncbi:hypothetical protein NPIRD3C_1194 [Nitrosopumilus piranensis]|uniref:Uncharacterized protein n=2 Tax=Nitrosopumilus piranensis TaxID=1582439 RepID=A0A0C5BVV8_9ARCH|nr:hypothetical protein NPIRD3C_1194 [Nitrosopumilus piranensis]
MKLEYKSMIDELFSEFPKLLDVKITDITDHNVLWYLRDYINSGYVRFEAGRKELYRLSILIENYAAKYKVPLLATFETSKRYKYVEDRYMELVKDIPKVWIIGNFNNPSLAPQPPKNAEVISCDGTNLTEIWMVLTKGDKGPFGLVAEDIGDGMFRGFFSISPTIINKAIEITEKSLKTKIDFDHKVVEND